VRWEIFHSFISYFLLILIVKEFLKSTNICQSYSKNKSGPVFSDSQCIIDYFPTFKELTWPWPRPFQGRFVVRRLGLTTINPHIKFEVSVFTHYDDMKGNAKSRNWGGLGIRVTQGHHSPAMSPFYVARTTSYSTRNYASILCSFRVIASYLSKFADFDLPHLHLVLPLGVIPFRFRGDLWQKKTRVPEFSCDIACMIICLAVLIQFRRVTDRQTNGRTDKQSHDDG